jgi:hypothetical protein
MFQFMPQNFKGFADLCFHSPLGKAQFFGYLLVLKAFKAIHFKYLFAFYRQFIDDFIDFLLQFHCLDLSFQVFFKVLFKPYIFKMLVLYISLIDIIDTTVVNRAVEIGFERGADDNGGSFLIKPHKKILYNFPPNIHIGYISAGKYNQGGVILVKYLFEAISTFESRC